MARMVKVAATKATRGKLAFPTRASWVKHVAISGGVVTRLPSGPDAGKLAARYGGKGTRYPTMAPRYDLAPVNVRALDAAASRSDTIDQALDAPREFIMRDYSPELNRAFSQGLKEVGNAVHDLGIPPWVLPAVGAALVAYAVNTFMPRRR